MDDEKIDRKDTQIFRTAMWLFRANAALLTLVIGWAILTS